MNGILLYYLPSIRECFNIQASPWLRPTDGRRGSERVADEHVRANLELWVTKQRRRVRWLEHPLEAAQLRVSGQVSAPARRRSRKDSATLADLNTNLNACRADVTRLERKVAVIDGRVEGLGMTVRASSAQAPAPAAPPQPVVPVPGTISYKDMVGGCRIAVANWYTTQCRLLAGTLRKARR